MNTATVAPGLAATTGTLTGQSADFSAAGTLKVRVKAAAQDQLALTSTTTVPALKMGGTSTLVADMTGYLSTDPDGSYVVATAPSWITGTANGFKNFSAPNNTSGKQVRLSYNSISASSKQVIVNVGGNVTPVTIERFDARLDGAGVALIWNAVSEFQNAGFNVYRRDLRANDWTRVNAALIAGRITNPDPKAYAFYDWPAPGAYEYMLESVALNGSAETYDAPAAPVTVDAAACVAATNEAISGATESIGSVQNAQRSKWLRQLTAASEIAVAPSVKVFNRPSSALSTPETFAVGARGINEIAAAPSVAVHPQAGARFFTNSTAASASSVSAKVVYGASGVLLIKQTDLPAGFDIDHVSIQREGRAVTPLALTDAGLLVYAPGYEDDYTNKDVLFLRVSSAATTAGGVAHAQGLFAENNASTQSPANATLAFHDVYFDYNSNFRPFVFEPWFANQYLTASATTGSVVSEQIAAPRATNAAATLTVNVWSLTSQAHTLQAVLNGVAIGQIDWTGGQKMLQVTFQVPPSVLTAGNNNVELVTPAGIDQTAFLHSITVAYTQTLDGATPLSVANTGASSALYEVSNVPTPNVWVVDTRSADRATLVPYEAQAQTTGMFAIRFNAATGGSGQFLVVPAGQENRPASVTKRLVKPLNTNANYWAIGQPQFQTAIQPLLAAHTKEGIRGTFIDQEQLFDAYNFGRYGPAGIQKAIRSVRPNYVLLLGRTTYDYKNYSGANVDPMCPAFLVATTFWAQTTSDSMFGDLGRGYPEVAVGRLPVNNLSELSTAGPAYSKLFRRTGVGRTGSCGGR